MPRDWGRTVGGAQLYFFIYKNMGVNAEIYFKCKTLSGDQIHELLSTLANTAPKMVDNNTYIVDIKKESTDLLERYPNLLKNGQSIYALETLVRYYGEGYRRGYWPDQCRCINIIRDKTKATIYYGNDSSHSYFDILPPILTVKKQNLLSIDFCNIGQTWLQ